MNSKEIVRRTVEYNGPERVARSYHESDICFDCCSARTYATEWKETSKGKWERTDEWGSIWARVDAASKGEVARGVLENNDNYDKYELPDYSRPEDYANVAAKCQEHPDKWHNGMVPGFTFKITREMFKLENYLADLLLEAELMHRLHDRVDAMIEDMIMNYAAAGVDGIMIHEDWGTQHQTLVSPELWKKEFFPRFRKLCGKAHDFGLKVFMHSCGRIEGIVPDLIEAGIDVLQFDQPDLHGIDTLAAYQQKAKITFWSPVDIQKTLQTKDEGIIREKAREMLDKLWHGRGGFIAGYYWDNESIGLESKWQDYACDEFTKSGIASRYTAQNKKNQP